jgi:hypothetical protein
MMRITRSDTHAAAHCFTCSGGLWSLSDFGIFGQKSELSYHQNTLEKNQNDLYAILERRVFKVRQAPMTAESCWIRRSQSAATDRSPKGGSTRRTCRLKLF